MGRDKWKLFTRLSAVILALVALGTMVLHADRAGAAKTISLRNSIAGTECEGSEYLFILNGLDNSSDAPKSIQVLLSNQVSLTVGVSKLNKKLAQYSLAAGDVPEGQTPVNAFADVPDNYSGNFVISHVPCGPTPSPSPSPEPSPSPSPEPSPSPTP